ncbi:MAG TPA: SWIM zinc finger family protein, partial [Thermoanaerobaculia bacterium]|nr:SWIM zinc finger family protein [Thermoanaerobaculia bacterium]
MAFIVLSKLERFVPSEIRKRGAEYARGGAVRIRARRSPENPLRADVYGSDLYDVALAYSERALWATCTCPYFERDLDICKHIWATVIRCEQTAVSFPGPVDDLLSEGEPDFDDDEDDPGVDEEYVPRSAPPRAPHLRPVPSRWRSQLGTVDSYARDAIDGASVPDEIIWVLDPEESGTSIQIQITSRGFKKNGERTKPKAVRIDPAVVSRIPDARDREILATLTTSSYGWDSLETSRSIGWPLAEYLVPKLIETGRLWIRIAKSEYAPGVTLDAGEPWRLKIQAVDGGGKYALAASFYRGDETIAVHEPLAVTRGGFLIFRDTIARFADEGTHAWASLLRRDRIEIPAKE